MGNFYVNISLKADRAALKSLLDHISDQSVIGPEHDGWLTFSSKLLDHQDQQIIDDYAVGLSKQFAGPIITALNHDDDILSIDVYKGGAQVATYNSRPGYFLENATEADMSPRITHPEEYDALAPGGGPAVSEVLNQPSVFACETHAKFAQLIGLPGQTAGFGFRYAERGEFDTLTLTWAGRGDPQDS